MLSIARASADADANRLHDGITMHKLPVGSGFPALLFTVGSALIFLIALPSLWFFLGMAVLFGVGIAAVLHLVHG